MSDLFIALFIHQTHSLVNYIIDIEINKARSLALKEVLVSSGRECVKIAKKEWNKGIWECGRRRVMAEEITE